MIGIRKIIGLTLSVLVWAAPVSAQTQIKIGILTDMSGPYSDSTGNGSVVAARLAVEDFKPQDHGMTVEVISADHQNKPDIGATIARRWIDEDGVDVIADVPTSSVALAVNEIVRTKNKILLVSGSVSSELTGKACSPNTVQWTLDTWAVGNAIARVMVARGDDSWFFLTADYAYGKIAQADTAAAVARAGGHVVGSVRTPFPSFDFSSYLIQAQQSGAKAVVFASAGEDTVNEIKQAAEYGLRENHQTLIALLMLDNEIHSLGLDVTQGLVFAAPGYWDLNEGTRAFSQRFAALDKGQMPNIVQMGVYGSVLHYLKAAAAVGAKDPARVVAEMKATPTDDPLFGKGAVRMDGRAIHPMYLLQVKAPSESKGPWDLLRVIDTIPADKAFRPLAEGGCPLVGR